MTDIATTYSNTTQSADWRMAGPDLASDAGLETALLLSLGTDLGSWWGDLPLANPGAPAAGAAAGMGSQLYLLRTAAATPETALRAQQYVTKALAWLVSDGIAQAVTATTRWLNPKTQTGALGIAISITRQVGGQPVSSTYDLVWSNSPAPRAQQAAGTTLVLPTPIAPVAPLPTPVILATGGGEISIGAGGVTSLAGGVQSGSQTSPGGPPTLTGPETIAVPQSGTVTLSNWAIADPAYASLPNDWGNLFIALPTGASIVWAPQPAGFTSGARSYGSAADIEAAVNGAVITAPPTGGLSQVEAQFTNYAGAGATIVVAFNVEAAQSASGGGSFTVEAAATVAAGIAYPVGSQVSGSTAPIIVAPLSVTVPAGGSVALAGISVTDPANATNAGDAAGYFYTAEAGVVFSWPANTGATTSGGNFRGTLSQLNAALGGVVLTAGTVPGSYPLVLSYTNQDDVQAQVTITVDVVAAVATYTPGVSGTQSTGSTDPYLTLPTLLLLPVGGTQPVTGCVITDNVPLGGILKISCGNGTLAGAVSGAAVAGSGTAYIQYSSTTPSDLQALLTGLDYTGANSPTPDYIYIAYTNQYDVTVSATINV
jgi:phage gp46-like protein